MDVFVFTNPNAPTKMEQGRIVNNIQSKMWIERYDKLGEFTFTGLVQDGLRHLLPIDSYVSHINTSEIMQVENHEISSSKDKDATIKITGRSLPHILEDRLGGATLRTYPFVDGSVDFWQPSEEPQWQIVNFINGVIDPGHVIDPSDGIDYIQMWSSISGGAAVPARYVKWGVEALVTVQEMLSAHKFGIKSIRPGPYTISEGSIVDTNSVILVYSGVDRRGHAIFSQTHGEVDDAEYFWSSRPKKTQAIVTGKWVGIRVGTGEVNDKRRTMFVDASSIDNLYNTAPTGAALTKIQDGMTRRGLDALARQEDLNMTNAQVSKEGTHLEYRKDYDVGDLITVWGEYNIDGSFRVNEYAEIEDDNGVSGYPTLVPV